MMAALGIWLMTFIVLWLAFMVGARIREDERPPPSDGRRRGMNAVADCPFHLDPSGPGLLLDAIRPDQFQEAEGDSRSSAAIASSTCFLIDSTNLSKFGLSGRSHGPAASTQFSTVTGFPAIRQASIALLAKATPVIVSIKARASSLVMAVLHWRKRSAFPESGCWRNGARSKRQPADASNEPAGEALTGGGQA